MLSQLSASVVGTIGKKAATGINPYDSPRLDEAGDNEDGYILYESLKVDPPDFSPELLDRLSPMFAFGEDAFRLHKELPVYGFWVVSNSGKDVSDAASKREALAYSNASRPFKFLNKDEKKGVNEAVTLTSVTARKQFPVLVDFEQGRVYCATTSQDMVFTVRTLIRELGGDVCSLRWDFDNFDWPQRFMAKVLADKTYEVAFNKRAQELTYFNENQVEPEEDRTLERIVSEFFAQADLGLLWCGLAPDAAVRLHKGGECVGVSSPGEVTNLLAKFDASSVASCTAVFQEKITKNRKGVDQTFFKKTFQINLGEKSMMADVGAVLLRGFEVCGFKRSIMKELKKTKTELTIAHYWFEYLRQMRNSVFEYVDNLTSTLDLNKAQYGLIASDVTDTDGEDLVEEV